MPILQGTPVNTQNVNPISRIMQGAPQIFMTAAQGIAQNNRFAAQISSQYIRDAAMQQINREQQRMQKEKMAQQAYFQEQNLALQREGMDLREQQLSHSMHMDELQLGMRAKVYDAQAAKYRADAQKTMAELDAAKQARAMMASMFAESPASPVGPEDSGTVNPAVAMSAPADGPVWKPTDAMPPSPVPLSPVDVKTAPIYAESYRGTGAALSMSTPGDSSLNGQILQGMQGQMNVAKIQAMTSRDPNRAAYYVQEYYRMRTSIAKFQQAAQGNDQLLANAVGDATHAANPISWLEAVPVPSLKAGADPVAKSKALENDPAYQLAMKPPAQMTAAVTAGNMPMGTALKGLDLLDKRIGYQQQVSNALALKYGVRGMTESQAKHVQEMASFGLDKAIESRKILNDMIVSRLREPQGLSEQDIHKAQMSAQSAFISSYNQAEKYDEVYSKYHGEVQDADVDQDSPQSVALMRIYQFGASNALRDKTQQKAAASGAAARIWESVRAEMEMRVGLEPHQKDELAKEKFRKIWGQISLSIGKPIDPKDYGLNIEM